MIKKESKNVSRVKRHEKIRRTLSGTSETPRLCVFRSNNAIYAQLIDDTKGKTMIAVNTNMPAIKTLIKGKTKREAAGIVGEELAKNAIAKKIKTVVFDRNGYVYTGRVAAVAEGARKGGLKF